MKKDKDTKKISPKEYAVARDSVKITKEKSTHVALEFRNKFSYNSKHVNNFSARFTS